MSELARLEAELAVASHNLREPLRMIRCYVDLLAEQPDDAGVCLARISEGAQRLEVLINGMFECFQLPEHFHPKSISMNLVSQNVISGLGENYRAAIHCEDLPRVLGDFEILSSLLAKLLDNSLKFRGAAAPSIRLSAALEPSTGLWRFTMKDNGIGIEAAQGERCFDMFKRLHGREVPGEGFGLAYCRRAIELHGGRIWLDSTPGDGTAISFTLPAA